MTYGPGGYNGAGLVMVDQPLWLETPVTISDLAVANSGTVNGPRDLTISGSLTANGGTTEGFSGGHLTTVQDLRRWTALRPSGAGINMSAACKSSWLAISRQ